jgi:hypothetical protein
VHFPGNHAQQHGAEGGHHGQARQCHQQFVEIEDEFGHRTLLVRKKMAKWKRRREAEEAKRFPPREATYGLR